MKYVFFDIDNTLISHRGISHIPPETREAINLLRSAGHVPAIATGRGAFLSRSVAREFGMTHLVCSGGAQLFVDGQEIQRVMFPSEHIDGFREVAAKFPRVCAALDERYLYASDAFSSFFDYFNGQAGYNCIRPLEELVHPIICYVMLSHRVLTPEYGMFYSAPEGVRLELMNAFTEARCEGTSKWLGIVKMIETVGASLEDVIVFGDGPNDIDMLRNANIGVAVGNASESVKAAADYVCEDIDDGGILSACKHLGII